VLLPPSLVSLVALHALVTLPVYASFLVALSLDHVGTMLLCLLVVGVAGHSMPVLLLVLGVCAAVRSGLCLLRDVRRIMISTLQRNAPRFAVVAFLPMSCRFLCVVARDLYNTVLGIV
jgi:hypothetical protein